MTFANRYSRVAAVVPSQAEVTFNYGSSAGVSNLPPLMYGKIFEQIYDSSIAEDWQIRTVFQDMIILADENGVVDRTPEAIARRTNVPIEIVSRAIERLQKPDPTSRSPEENGARIKLLDDHRTWGWEIINFEYYRNLASAYQKRERTKLRTRKWRNSKCECDQASPSVTKRQRHASASASASVQEDRGMGKGVELPECIRTARLIEKWKKWIEVRMSMKKPKSWETLFREQADWLSQFGEDGAFESLSASIRNGWQGLFEPKTHEQPKPTTSRNDPSKSTRNPGGDCKPDYSAPW